MESFLNILAKFYPESNFSIVEDDNDPSSCVIYTDDCDLVDDEVEVLEIIDLALENLDYENVHIIHELDENRYL